MVCSGLIRYSVFDAVDMEPEVTLTSDYPDKILTAGFKASLFFLTGASCLYTIHVYGSDVGLAVVEGCS